VSDAAEATVLRVLHGPLSACHRRGISLLEVLAAIGVLSIGLLGLAALLPVGRYTISEATKADRTGDCGRAAMRDVVVRRMLDYYNWYDPHNPATGTPTTVDFANPKPQSWYDLNGNPTVANPPNAPNYSPNPLPPAFIIDPLGVSSGITANFGGPSTNTRRITLGVVQRDANGNMLVKNGNHFFVNQYTSAVASQLFVWPDDLIVNMPEDMTPPRAAGRPISVDASGNPLPLTNKGDYSWFASVVPAPNNPRRFTVSIVVCCKRDLTATATVPPAAVAERAVPILPVTNFFDGGVGGGSVQLQREINDIGSDNPPAGINIKENDWVALCSTSGATSGLCRWYRVGSIGDNTSYLTLIGPNWTPSVDPNHPDKLVALGQSVLGVYTTTIDLDTDPTWKN